ncbi:hypothetical protein AVEN_108376-1 [Araneus ventricosus]|uniref:Uncharacterized protein n=1 Tax=Araneus ventricosus TaxID=182803 RepID=A0A4Y2CVB8_ARAVE|nr:hypothetical protein AVEN_108376-1 [Araneus ventricosus]
MCTSERINDINHLKQRITDVINSVTPDVLTRVWEELDYRLDVCRATNGAHIELHGTETKIQVKDEKVRDVWWQLWKTSFFPPFMTFESRTIFLSEYAAQVN